MHLLALSIREYLWELYLCTVPGETVAELNVAVDRECPELTMTVVPSNREYVPEGCNEIEKSNLPMIQRH
jgi:hypothetical protein